MSKKTRVLMLGRYDHEQVRGGVQNYAKSVIDAVGTDVEMDAVVSSDKLVSDIKSIASGNMWRVGSLGVLSGVPISPTMLFRLWERIRNGNYDIIHFNFPDPMAMLSFLVLPKTCRFIVTWHSDVVKQKWALWLYKPLLNYFLKKVDLIMASTQALINSSTQIPAEVKPQVKVVPFGIPGIPQDIEIKKPETLQKLDNKAILFTLGRHCYYKGYQYLIQAMRFVPDAYLFMAGTGPLTAEYEKIIDQYKLNDRVFLLGQISDEEVLAYYQFCDIFCLPSVEPSEAFGYVQVEAMRFGKPVINCDLGNGVNEVSPHEVTGLTAKVKDPKGIAAAIQRMLGEPELYERLSKSALKRSQDFTMTHFGERVSNYYQTLGL